MRVDPDPQTGERLDYFEFSQRLEKELRAAFSDEDIRIRIIGFAKQMGDISEGATSVIEFFAMTRGVVSKRTFQRFAEGTTPRAALRATLPSLVPHFANTVM